MKPQKKTNIDLSKCKVGQRVRLRNGKTTKIVELDSMNTILPVKVGNGNWHRINGLLRLSNTQYPNDIVAILPAKKAKKPAGKADNLDKLRRLIADFEAGRDVFTKELNRLKELLKP